MAKKRNTQKTKYLTCPFCSKTAPGSDFDFIPNGDMMQNTEAWRSLLRVYSRENELPSTVEEILALMLVFQRTDVKFVLCKDCASEYTFNHDASDLFLGYWLYSGEWESPVPVLGNVEEVTDGVFKIEVFDLEAAEKAFYSALEALGEMDEDLEEKIVLEMNTSDWKRFFMQVSYERLL